MSEPGQGHNGQLKSIVDRINNLMDARDEVSSDIRDVFAEAKGNGFDIPALRAIVRTQRRLVVECDGHNFHERTKEQAAKDRARDRWLTSKDYDVFRFTGSELWRNPMACAEQVTDWALKGWF